MLAHSPGSPSKTRTSLCRPAFHAFLSTVQVSDIDPSIVKTEISTEVGASMPLFSTKQPTNGVAYLRGGSSTLWHLVVVGIHYFCLAGVTNIKRLPLELRQYVPLFCSFVTLMGTGQARVELSRFSLPCGKPSSSLFVMTHLHRIKRLLAAVARHRSAHGRAQHQYVHKHMDRIWALANAPNLLLTLFQVQASSAAHDLWTVIWR
jgi:hypothetical protein